MSTAKKIPQLRIVDGGAAHEADRPGELAGKYRILFDQASDAIMTALPSGEIDEVNQAFEELAGYMRTELDGASAGIFSPDSTKHRIPERARPFSQEMFGVPGMYEDIAILRKDGYVRLVDLNVRHVKSGTQKLSLAMFRDLTAKKSMERELITKHAELINAYRQLESNHAELTAMQEALVQAGKMAALGELAAGIAHELNQPLQGIRGYAQELEEILPRTGAEKRPEVAMSLREIISNVDKMAKIISYLRTFTRRSTEGHEEVDVHVAIEEALKMLNRQFAARGIEVERRFAKELPKVYANPLQLEQVFINLFTNARDAIEATNRGRGRVAVTTKKSGNFVEVTVQDDGIGMSEKEKGKAFNPFFTTKEVGKGMGLGLSISYGILSKLHASIVVESELGKGAAFKIRVPRDFRELA